MPCSSLPLLLLALHGTIADVRSDIFGFHGGSASGSGCSCATSVSSVVAEVGSGVDSSCFYSASAGSTFNSGTVCATFNSGTVCCAAHDMGQEPYCGAANPGRNTSYCAASWCYVQDVVACKLSPHRVRQSSFIPGEFYSYSLCSDGVSSSAADTIASSLKFSNVPFEYPTRPGLVIRAALSSTNYWPVAWKRNVSSGMPLCREKHEPRCQDSSAVDPVTLDVIYHDDNQAYEGALVAYLRDLQQIAGVAVLNFTWVSTGARAVHGANAYDAALSDINAGLLDMLAGDPWVTENRLLQVDFTSVHLYDDRIYLWVPQEMDPTITQSLGAVFDPFTFDLWAFIISTIAVVGLLQQMLKVRDDTLGSGDEDPQDEVAFTRRGSLRRERRRSSTFTPVVPFSAGERHVGMEPEVKDDEPELPVRKSTLQRQMTRGLEAVNAGKKDFYRQCIEAKSGSLHYEVAEGLYRSFMGAMMGVDAGDWDSLPERITNISFAFFMLTIMTAFTANMAAFLGARQSTWRSVEEVLDAGGRVCASSSLLSGDLGATLYSLYPGYSRNQFAAYESSRNLLNDGQ